MNGSIAIVAFAAGFIMGATAATIFFVWIGRRYQKSLRPKLHQQNVPSFIEYIEQYEDEKGELKAKRWREYIH